ncbi:MAG TPA: hypothetical protein VKP88_04980, partial [Candidatus Paceibacterota bacterium]|nr:hypothetical protein [Candidatus Paceibacterota bacterium]
LDGDFHNYGSFDANGGEVVANATAFDVADAIINSNSGNLSEINNPTGLTFNNDGTKVYVLDGDDDINEYTLTLPYDIASASFVHATSVTAQDSSPGGITFKADGSKMYTTGGSTGSVFEYDLGTAFDVSTAVYVRATTTSGAKRDVDFNVDGTTMYLVNDNGDYIQQFSLGTAFDVSTAAFVGEYDVTTETASPQDFFYAPSGKLFYVAGGGEFIYKYRTPTAFAITSAELIDTISVLSTEEPTINRIAFDTYGRQVFTIGGTNETIHAYDLDDEQLFTGTFSATSSLYDFTVGDTATVSPASETEVDRNYTVNGSAAGPYAGLVELTGTSTLSGAGNFGFVEVQGTASSTESTLTFTDLTVAAGADFTASTSLTILGDYSTAGSSTIPRGNETVFGGQGTYNGLELTYLSATATPALYDSPRDVEFSPDGAMMFVLDREGSNSPMTQYNLTIPWDVTSAAFVQATNTGGNGETIPTGAEFSTDGRNMYVVGSGIDQIEQYRLSTPWDINTADYWQSIPSGSGNSSDLEFTPDGLQLHILSYSGANGLTRVFNLTNPWDLSTATFTDAFAAEDGVNTDDGQAFSPDGTAMFQIIDDTKTIHYYALSTPWDLSTRSTVGTVGVSDFVGGVTNDIEFSTDGRYLYIVEDDTTEQIHQFAIGSTIGTSTANERFDNVTLREGGAVAFTGPFAARDLTIGSTATVTAPASTLTLDGDFHNYGSFDANGGEVVADATAFDIADAREVARFDVSGQAGTLTDIHFSPNGTKMYVPDNGGQEINQYTLTVPFNVSTAAFDYSTSTSAQDSVPIGVVLSHDGTNMYMAGANTYDVFQYTLSTPFDIATADFTNSSTTVAPGSGTLLSGLAIKPDGTKLYTIDRNPDDVFEFDLTTPFDITTANYVNNFALGTNINPFGITFSPDGAIMIVQIETVSFQDELRRYSLSTPWDITTASFDAQLIIEEVDNDVEGVWVSADGSHAFIAGNETDDIIQLTLDGIQYFTGS